MAADKHSIGSKALSAMGRLLRGMLRHLPKGMVLAITALMALTFLEEEAGGAATRFSGVFLIAVFCVSFAYLFIVSPRVRVRIPGLERQDETSPEGDVSGARDGEPEVTVQVVRLDARTARVSIANDAPLPVLRAQTSLALTREDDGTAVDLKGMSLSLPAHSVVPAPLGQAFNHVGIYRLHSAGVRVYDLLGVFSRANETPGQWRIRVVPNIYRLTRGIPQERKMSQSDLGIPDTPADALDYDRVRDWRPGDPLKTIHWKLVAHSQGELYTKLFETSTATGVVLVIDPYGYDAGAGSAETALHLCDTMLEGGLSLMEHARESGIPGSIRFLERAGGLVSSPWAGPGMRGWLVEMARRPEATRDALGASLQAIASLREGNGGYAIVATGRLSEESVGELIACRQAGVPLLVVHALSGGSNREATQQRSYDARLRSASITVIPLTSGPQIIREVTTS